MTVIRPYLPEDDKAIVAMLEAEGIKPDETQHRKYETICLVEDEEVVGFYTMILKQTYPSLYHFCITADRRTGMAARKLLAHFILYCKEHGHKAFVTHAPEDKPGNRKAIEYYFNVQPYARSDGKLWYLVEVSR